MMKLKVNEDADDVHFQINNILFFLNMIYYKSFFFSDC
jgi:hypothetical protein